MYSPKCDNKFFTESKVIWLVFIYSDLFGKYRNIIDVPKNEMAIHEFDNKKSLKEYLYTINAINDELNKITFHYMIVEQSIDLSTKYTNKSEIFNI